MNQSIWSQSAKTERRPPLPGDCSAEIVVIGAGMAGILTAYLLQKAGKQVIVIEANQIGSGQTRNTTAKITSQHGAIYAWLMSTYGYEKAKQYAEANEEAIQSYAQLVESEKIDCHFEWVDSFLYSVDRQGDLKQEAEAAKALGMDAEYISHLNLPFGPADAVRFGHQAQFHPLEFIYALAEQLTVYEDTRALKTEKNRVITNRGIIRASKIVFAAHFPFPVVPGFYFARLHQERSYVMALSGVTRDQVPKGLYYGIGRKALSMRWYQDLLLVGGGGHRCGDKSGACGYGQLQQQVNEIFPDAKIWSAWAAQDCMPQDGLPLIGQFSVLREGQYVISGLQKWGMTGSMVGAKIVTGLICGNAPAYAALFKPQRICVKAGYQNFLKDMKYSISGMAGGLVLRKKPRCPHMGCELKWNEEERTWDCPCHGSRFSEDGALLDNPANGDRKEDLLG